MTGLWYVQAKVERGDFMTKNQNYDLMSFEMQPGSYTVELNIYNN